MDEEFGELISEYSLEQAIEDGVLVEWRLNIKDTLPEEDQMFVTEIDGKNVWVIEDGQAITMMYPEDY